MKLCNELLASRSGAERRAGCSGNMEEGVRAEFLATSSVANTYSNRWPTVVLRTAASVAGVMWACTHAVTGEPVTLPDIVESARNDVTRYSVDMSTCVGPLRMRLSHNGRDLMEWTLLPCFVLAPAIVNNAFGEEFLSWEMTGFAAGADDAWFAIATTDSVAIVDRDAGGFRLQRHIHKRRLWMPEAVLRTPADTLLVSFCDIPTLHEFSREGTLLRRLPVERNITCMALRNDVVVCIEHNDDTLVAFATVIKLDGGEYTCVNSFPLPTRAMEVGDAAVTGLDHELRSVCVLADGKQFAFAEYIVQHNRSYFDVFVTIMDFTGAVVRAFLLRDPASPQWAAQPLPWDYVSDIVCTDNNEIVLLANSLDGDLYGGTVAHVYSVYGEHLTSWTFSDAPEPLVFGFPLVCNRTSLYASAPFDDRLCIATSTA